jgi:hypothetical protein
MEKKTKKTQKEEAPQQEEIKEEAPQQEEIKKEAPKEEAPKEEIPKNPKPRAKKKEPALPDHNELEREVLNDLIALEQKLAQLESLKRNAKKTFRFVFFTRRRLEVIRTNYAKSLR